MQTCGGTVPLAVKLQRWCAVGCGVGVHERRLRCRTKGGHKFTSALFVIAVIATVELGGPAGELLVRARNVRSS